MRSLVLNFICLMLLAFSLSCKKDEDEKEVKYPISLKYKSFTRNKMRMWTKSGEVLDQQKITDFAGNSFSNIFDGGLYEIKLKTPDSADVRFPSAMHGVWTTKILDTGHIMFNGDVQLFPGMVFGNQATLDRSFLIYKSNIYTKGIRIVQQPSLLPPIIYKADLGFIANGNNKGLVVPGYLYKMRLYTRAATYNGHMFGEFKDNFLDELQDRDTLVIQVTKNNWVL